jgi:hypothetical protein
VFVKVSLVEVVVAAKEHICRIVADAEQELEVHI